MIRRRGSPSRRAQCYLESAGDIDPGQGSIGGVFQTGAHCRNKRALRERSCLSLNETERD
jgi:hypothetical protein